MTWPTPPQVRQVFCRRRWRSRNRSRSCRRRCARTRSRAPRRARRLQGDLHAVAQIAAALRAVATTAAAATSTAEELLEDATAAAAEDLAEDIEGIVEATATGGGAAHAASEGGVAVAIIGGAFLIVAEHVVGLSDLLELAFGALVIRVFVRVKLHRELAVGFFQILGGNVARDAEHFVIIAFVCHEGVKRGLRLRSGGAGPLETMTLAARSMRSLSL
jgi:hypothetical protein